MSTLFILTVPQSLPVTCVDIESGVVTETEFGDVTRANVEMIVDWFASERNCLLLEYSPCPDGLVAWMKRMNVHFVGSMTARNAKHCKSHLATESILEDSSCQIARHYGVSHEMSYEGLLNAMLQLRIVSTELLNSDASMALLFISS